MQAAIQLTLDGIGYGLLPEPEVRHLLACGRLQRICPQWQLPHYSVYAVTPSVSLLRLKRAPRLIVCVLGLSKFSTNPELFVGEP